MAQSAEQAYTHNVYRDGKCYPKKKKKKEVYIDKCSSIIMQKMHTHTCYVNLWLRWIASKFKWQQQKWEHSPCFTSAEISWNCVWCNSREIKLMWHFGFQPTPAYERKNIKLLLSSLKQFHTTNILAALLKRSALYCHPEWCHLVYQCSEMSSRSQNNCMTWDAAATASCVLSKHAVTSTRPKGPGFITG